VPAVDVSTNTTLPEIRGTAKLDGPSPFSYVHSNAVNLQEPVILFHDFSSFAKDKRGGDSAVLEV
jgi:hypothetical protein